MLLRRVKQLPQGPEWAYGVKWDGYRMQAIKSGDVVRLLSRNGADYTTRFPEVASTIAKLKARTVHLDGELVAMDEQGRPSFQILQGPRPLPEGWCLGYCCFDLLRIGNDCLQKTCRWQ